MLQQTPTQEVWKEIPGYESFYQVSNLGRIRSLPRSLPSRSGFRTRKGKILKLKLITNGYRQIQLYGIDNSVFSLIHRLVAICFVDNPFGLPEVNHIDGDKSNNASSNLEWNDRVQNMQHALSTGLKNSRPDLHKNAKKVVDTKTGAVYLTVAEAAKALGVSRPLMSVWLSGRQTNKSNCKFLIDATTS